MILNTLVNKCQKIRSRYSLPPPPPPPSTVKMLANGCKKKEKLTPNFAFGCDGLLKASMAYKMISDKRLPKHSTFSANSNVVDFKFQSRLVDVNTVVNPRLRSSGLEMLFIYQN